MSTPYIGTHIVHITDTGSEKHRIESAYVRHTALNGIQPYHLAVEHRDSPLEIGALASALVHNPERAQRLIIAVNCAPPDKENGTKDNVRNDFFMADLGDGIVVCGTRAGLEMSYFKDKIKHLYQLTASNEKHTQFRSLETLPEYTVQFSDPEKRAELLARGKIKEVSVDQYIKPVPDISHVYKVDDSKNITFYVSERDRALLERSKGKKVRVQFGKASIEVAGDTLLKGAGWFWNYKRRFTATISENFFDGPQNKNYLNLNSSEAVGDRKLPQILTLRQRHTVTKPRYPIPKVGAHVKITVMNG